MSTAMDGSELPTKPLPVPAPKAMSDLLASMVDMKAQHVPSATGIYGDQGTGKSVSGMKFLQAIVPRDRKILYVDSALNWTSFQNHPELMERVKLMQYENIEQLTVLARMLRISPELREKIGGVMLDEYSVMSARDQAWIVRARSEQMKEEGKFKDPFQPTLPDYLGQKLRSGELVTDFLAAKVHVMFIAHEKLDEIKVIQPDFPEKTGKEWQRLLHGVYHATLEVTDDSKDDVYKLQLKPFNRISAKNRIGGLGRFATIDEVSTAYKKWGITQEPSVGIVEASEKLELEDSDDADAEALLKLIGK